MTLAQRARRLNRGRDRPPHLPHLILITDRARLGDPVPLVARLPRGAAVILRDRDLADRRALAERLARLCRRRGIRLLIAGDGRLARRVRAGGLHLSEAEAQRRPRFRHPRWLVTAAAHGRAALHRAAAAGADLALLSPVFATRSHPGARVLGPLRFAALARLSPLPVCALGGVSAASLRRLTGSGARAIAAIDGFAAA